MSEFKPLSLKEIEQALLEQLQATSPSASTPILIALLEVKKVQALQTMADNAK